MASIKTQSIQKEMVKIIRMCNCEIGKLETLGKNYPVYWMCDVCSEKLHSNQCFK